MKSSVIRAACKSTDALRNEYRDLFYIIDQESIAQHNIQYCVHVRNIPVGVRGVQLADLFNSQVWNVLIRYGENPQTDPFEAWILNIPLLKYAEELVNNVKEINGVPIECRAEKEPLNEWTLCVGNRNGRCKHAEQCIYRHVMCSTGDDCRDEMCPFSHSIGRVTEPSSRKKSSMYVERIIDLR